MQHPVRTRIAEDTRLRVRGIARSFARTAGQSWVPQTPGVDHAVATRLAQWYEWELAVRRPVTVETARMWLDLGVMINAQYRALAEIITVTVTEDDPYTAPEQLFADLDTRHMRVFASGPDDHPLWTADQNDRFRVVHDVFGHYASGVHFTAEGEDAAYRSHALMFPPSVLPALTCETRAQNAALNYGSRPGTFPEQITVPVPAWGMVR